MVPDEVTLLLQRIQNFLGWLPRLRKRLKGQILMIFAMNVVFVGMIIFAALQFSWGKLPQLWFFLAASLLGSLTLVTMTIMLLLLVLFVIVSGLSK